jgi:hypothetical protein
MLIMNEDTGTTHDEPLCSAGCGGFAAILNPLCEGPHAEEAGEAVFARICAAVGHIPGLSERWGGRCLRCRAPLPTSPVPAEGQGGHAA